MKIIAVDCNYVQAEFATSYLLIENQRGIFIECNTNYAIPYLLEAAAKEGLAPQQIEGLIITHVHLDHAGGAGLFLEKFPNARLYAHPRAARHAIDPSKLIQSATAVYGAAFMQKLYGTILPCDPQRVTMLADGQNIPFQGGEIQTKHTRGHANHHLVAIEPITKTLFSGDSFGVSYPKLGHHAQPMIIASTSPTDFDGVAAIETVKWIADQDLNQIALTHYGFIPRELIQSLAKMLEDQLVFSTELVREIDRDRLSESQVLARIESWMLDYFLKLGIVLDAGDLRLLHLDFKVNAQGLCYAATRLASAAP